MLRNNSKDVKAQCQILWFPWQKELPETKDTFNDLSKTYSKDISSHLVNSCTFSKNIGQAAGSFTFFLDNSRDWKRFIKPGQWCVICMDNDGELSLPQVAGGNPDLGLNAIPDADIQKPETREAIRKKVRAICYIERVSVSIDTLDNGALDVIYEVSGRDFGVVYEQTEIWYNYFKFEQLQVIGLASQLRFTTTNSIKELLDVTHDLFYAPDKVIASKDKASLELTEVGTQWVLPKTMLEVLGIKLRKSKPPLFGNIENLKKFDTTLCRIPLINPLDYINGRAWEKLKQFSISELHELFPELDATGHPRLVFRPIPWAILKKGFPSIAGALGSENDSVNSFPLFYLNLANSENNINIAALDVISASVGEDGHNRYNHFFTTMKSSLNIPESNISILKDRPSKAGRLYPNLQKGSVRRHGFRPMHVDINTFQFAADPLRGAADKKNGAPDSTILLEYNELVLDYWNNAVFFETGSVKLLGNNAVRVGNTITFENDVPYNANKVFYIEEYVDEFTIGERGEGFWTQTLQLTRGIEKFDLALISGFAVKDENFEEVGTFTKD